MKKLALAGSVALLALVPAVAHADSLVYVKGGNVFSAHSDGSGAEQLSNDGQAEWPSGADNGVVAYEDTNDGRIYVLKADGTADHSMTTQGSYQFPKAQHVRISPDGSKIAYDVLINYSDYSTLWTPTSSTNINNPNQTLGQEDYVSPTWFGNRLMLVHSGSTFPGQQETTYYNVGDADNNEQNWFSDDPSNFTPTGYDSAISRDGGRMALMENDAADYTDTTPRHVTLLLLTGTGAPPAAPTHRCQIDLPADGSYYRGSPSFSPDGQSLAIGEADGVHVLALGDATNCAAIQSSNHLVIPGGSQPYWSAANPPASQTTTTTGGGLKASFAMSPKKPHAKKAVRFTGKLSGGTANKFSWSFGDHKNGTGAKPKHAYKKAGSYKVKLTIVAADGRKASVTKTIKVSR